MGFVHIVDHGARGAILRDELCALHTGAVNRRHRRRLGLHGVGRREQLGRLIVVVCGGASAPHRQVESVAGRGLCGRLGLRRWLAGCRRFRLSALCRRRLGWLRRLRMLRLVVTADRWEHQRRAVERRQLGLRVVMPIAAPGIRKLQVRFINLAHLSPPLRRWPWRISRQCARGRNVRTTATASGHAGPGSAIRCRRTRMGARLASSAGRSTSARFSCPARA